MIVSPYFYKEEVVPEVCNTLYIAVIFPNSSRKRNNYVHLREFPNAYKWRISYLLTELDGIVNRLPQ